MLGRDEMTVECGVPFIATEHDMTPRKGQANDWIRHWEEMREELSNGDRNI